MARSPLPIGSWGLIRTYPVTAPGMSKPKRYRAMANYRDFDGVTRVVEASGRTATQASQNLRMRLQSRTRASGHGELTGISRFSDAAVLWVERMKEMVADGRRSPGTIETYERQLRNHLLPAMGEVRLAEVTTPLVDKIIASIKRKVSPATARSCRSVISGVLGLAVRYGAITHNPVRKVERIESRPKRQPRALTAEERLNY